MPVAFEHFTHATLTDQLIEARVAHTQRMLTEEFPDDPPLVAEDSVKRMRHLPSTMRLHIWTLRSEGRIVAEGDLSWQEHESNRHLAHFSASVEPEYRRRGIGTALLALGVAKSRRAGRTLVTASSADRTPAGAAFLSRLGFAPGLETHLNQLDLAHLDRALLSLWTARGPERAPDYEVETWDDRIPETRIEGFAELASVMNTQPRGTLTIEDTRVTPLMIREGEACWLSGGGRTSITCARHVPTGALAGFSALYWSPNRASLVWQGDTGVEAQHRNKGLGRWLKAVNLQHVLEANHEARFVRTGNADANVPMLAINRALGFVPLVAQTAWQASIDEIAPKLAPWRERIRRARRKAS